jgi:hypothetical protein
MISFMPPVDRPEFTAIRQVNPRLVSGLAAFALAVAGGTTLATDPHIDLIERYGTNQVTIHFNTDAGRTYTLQYASTVNSGTWSNLATIPAEPAPNHYILVAPATNAFGLYRLSVTP